MLETFGAEFFPIKERRAWLGSLLHKEQTKGKNNS
jgi:hypothetical protein